ncbi:MAG: DUF5671 domain-containing protein [Paracoccaceae bacterium]|nr:DUF5671 domain-containing protein [Paracoccaceae bacterium]
MATNDILTQFVREALALGNSREDIQSALDDAGWSTREIAEAMEAFATTDFNPPVPKPRPQLTARDAFVYLVLFTALAFVATNLINLIHAVLDLILPDPGAEAWTDGRATDRARWSISILVIAAPVFVWMTLYTNRQIHEDAGHRRSLVRKWLTYLALFISALVFLGDAAFVIYSFLAGETTMRFLLKALTVACVSAAVFVFYLRDVEADADEQ